ncbi:MAG: DEAD/DEAH box helicase [Marinilabiliales bacterium]|nr:MAG: DEAD/DEAH box helicase [Marinilabiliales bacterium]
MTFNELDIIEPILRAVDEEGYTNPTPVQEQAIPIVLKGKDIIGCAQTGTGKTAAFAIPILQLLHNKINPQWKKRFIKAVIITPTRELAIQIGESFSTYGKYTQPKHAVIFGGVGQKPQTDALKNGVDILIATPGRLLDLINQGFVNLAKIDIFVLDEADRMLDMGFIHDIKKVIQVLPKKRHSLFFSATMPKEILKLANTIVYKPDYVDIAPERLTADAVEQSLYYIDKSKKKNLLIHLLEEVNYFSVLVFTRTKHGANNLARMLCKAGIKADAIHGNKSQSARQKALQNFKSGKLHVLVATDIASRGIDIDELALVVNFDIPNEPETYVHRIGRTGRAGLSGLAISFCSQDEIPYVKDINKLTGNQIPVIDEHPFVPENGRFKTSEHSKTKNPPNPRKNQYKRNFRKKLK